jgi:hypothetical protein
MTNCINYIKAMSLAILLVSTGIATANKPVAPHVARLADEVATLSQEEVIEFANQIAHNFEDAPAEKGLVPVLIKTKDLAEGVKSKDQRDAAEALSALAIRLGIYAAWCSIVCPQLDDTTGWQKTYFGDAGKLLIAVALTDDAKEDLKLIKSKIIGFLSNITSCSKETDSKRRPRQPKN